jgi:hypothetical protein
MPPDQEGLVYAELDPAAITYAKAAADPTGHYARPDVARLLFNPDPTPRVQRLAGLAATSATRATDSVFAADAGGGGRYQEETLAEETLA